MYIFSWVFIPRLLRMEEDFSAFPKLFLSIEQYILFLYTMLGLKFLCLDVLKIMEGFASFSCAKN